MFPDIHGQQRRDAGFRQRGFGVWRLGDGQLAILQHEPGPAGAELATAGCLEVFHELVVAAEVAVDHRRDLAGGLAAAVRFHRMPVECVVPHLRGIVEQAGLGLVASRFFDDFFERRLLEVGTFDQAVQVRHIGLMVLAMVVIEGLLGDVRGEGSTSVREVGKGKCHVSVLSCICLTGVSARLPTYGFHVK